MKKIILTMNAIVLMLTLSIVILPKFWIISVVGGADGIQGIAFPIMWTVYVVSVFLTAGFTLSWLIRGGK
jgi:lipopolysaccharide export LptBFGC system permease protein LptF